jgi:hypothetical protein
LALVAGCAGSFGGSPATSSAPPAVGVTHPPAKALSVSSSLKSGAVLTAALPWTADVAGGGVQSVDFLIDGKLVWTEKNAPYFFNDDGELLMPWLLGAGAHDLAVRATGTDGQAAQAVARVTTRGPSALPRGIVGTFTRTVTQADVDRTASNPGREAQTVPLGKWVMHLQPGLLRFVDALGGGGGEAVGVTSSNLRMFGSPNWILPPVERGGFCHAEPPVSFAWKHTGRLLQISGGGNCADRDAVFVGMWHEQG